MSEDHSVGRHVTYLEAPDIIFLKLSGSCTEEEGREINRRNREAASGLPHVFFLIDFAEAGNVPAVVRRVSAETLRSLPTRAIAVYAAPLRARVIATMVATAINFFRTDEDRKLLEFFDTEEEARAWIASVRRQILDAA
jgi:hypothetical protein